MATTTTITALATEFFAKLKGNVEAWRAGEIDYTIFSAYQQEAWAAIRAHGPALEEAVLRALRGSANSPTAIAGWRNTGHQRGAATRLPTSAIPRFHNRRFRIVAEQTPSGDQILHVAATTSATQRETAAFIYELAAELERRSDGATAPWVIWPDAIAKRVTIGLVSGQQLHLAQALAAEVVADLG